MTYLDDRKKEARGGSYQLRRRLEMPQTEELIVALWERDVEHQPGAQGRINDIQARRQAVKAKHPKGAS